MFAEHCCVHARGNTVIAVTGMSAGRKALAPSLLCLYVHAEQSCRITSKHAYASRGLQFEKYDATTPGSPGGNGEYPVQAGFGWTNGVVLTLLHEYGWNP